MNYSFLNFSKNLKFNCFLNKIKKIVFKSLLYYLIKLSPLIQIHFIILLYYSPNLSFLNIFFDLIKNYKLLS